MAGRSVSFSAHCDICDSHLETIAKWLSCNGDVWGVGPTVVFASAAALFLYNELEATIFTAGDHAHISALEKTLISSMVLGMLALMVHLWVCSMRFFQYYLDTLIRDSPSMLLEMTTAGLLGSQHSDIVVLGPLTKFLKNQQPQIHITICWFLSLCYADYVRKHYCQRFNMPYLEQWQIELQDRASRSAHRAMEKVNSFVGSVHQRLRGFSRPAPPSPDTDTVRARLRSSRRWMSAPPTARSRAECNAPSRGRKCACASSVNPVRLRLMPSRSYEHSSLRRDASAALHRTPATLVLAELQQNNRCEEERPWRSMAKLPF